MAEKQEVLITRTTGNLSGVLIGFGSETDWFDYRLEDRPRFLRRIAQLGKHPSWQGYSTGRRETRLSKRATGMIRLAFPPTPSRRTRWMKPCRRWPRSATPAQRDVVADARPLGPGKMSNADWADLRGRIESHGLSVTNVNAFTLFADGNTCRPTWIEDDPARRQARIDHTLACIDLAAGIKAAHQITFNPAGR